MRTLIARLVAVTLCAWLLMPASAPRAARDGQPAPEGIARLLQRLEQVVRRGDPDAYLGLLASTADTGPARDFALANVLPGATRVVVRERDRVRLAGGSGGGGFRLAVDVFAEFNRRARLATWSLDVSPKATTDGDDEWAIAKQQTVSSFGALYNLALGPRQYEAKNLVLRATDFELRLPQGSVFTAETEEGPTVLLLVGGGQMIFRPTPPTEREQLRIFARSETLETPFTSAFVRVAPYYMQRYVASGTMTERRADPNDMRTATALFRQDNPKSFGVDLADLTADSWSLVPGAPDLVAEVHTKRFGVLTYARSAHENEDVTVFDRARGRNISIYPSAEKLAQRGPFYSDDDDQECEVIHYDIDTSLDPARQYVEGTARLTLRTRKANVNAVTLRLAETLAVRSIVSREFGRLIALRVRNQNSVLVNLPKPVARGAVIAFTIIYNGRVTPQMIDREAISLDDARGQEVDEEPDIPLEPSYLYSNRSYWYPQGETTTYATATLRVTVPAGFRCVASGDPNPMTVAAMSRPPVAGTELVFRALQPVRYLSVLVARLTPLPSRLLRRVITDALSSQDMTLNPGVFYRDVEIGMFAAPRMRNRTPAFGERAGDILRFYASLVGDCPYPRLTVALVERELPGGHSPAYLAIISQPVLPSRLDWRGDPTSFSDFPEFFIAHEIAHQWWGQAVGWKNYHEQWLSEGFAQYFAALYAERLRGSGVFNNIVERLQSWAVKKSGEGPVYLGYRIGHVKRDSQLFRAIVYNKSAAVLHMLRRLLGDDAFFRGLRRFYQEYRFRKAGSDDLRRAFEAESQQSLTRFFERWVYNSKLPRIRFSHRTERDATTGRETIVLRFDQAGDVFDIPVTVTLDYADRPPSDVLVKVTEAMTEMRVPLAGKLRGVDVNRDKAAVARIER